VLGWGPARGWWQNISNQLFIESTLCPEKSTPQTIFNRNVKSQRIPPKLYAPDSEY